MLFETTPRMNANAATLLSHTTRLPRSLRSACAVGEESSPRRGSALSRAGSTPVPTSRPAAIRAAATSSSTRRRDREQQHQRPGAGERAQLLRPPERRRPAQPAGAAGGVGDHPQQQGQPHDRAPQLERDPACRRELARERAHADEHRHDRHRRQGKVGRPAGGQAARDEAGELREPQDRDARRDRGHRREKRRPAPDGPGEHELHPARVLLGLAAPAPPPAARTPRRRSPASRRRARRCSRRPSAGRTARRRTGGAPCCSAKLWANASRPDKRRVGVAVADRLDVGVDREQVARTRSCGLARPGMPAGPARARAWDPCGQSAGARAARRARRPEAGRPLRQPLGQSDRSRAVVVVQEDLLERRLAARQRRDRMLGERGDQRADAARDLEPQRVRARRSAPAYARQRRERRRLARRT